MTNLPAVIPPSESGEVLHITDKSEARPIIDYFKRQWRASETSGILAAVALRRLQDESVHTLYGFDRFGDFAQAKLGINESTARGVSAEGKLILTLVEAERIDLNDPDTFPGARALRGLRMVSKDREHLLAVFDNARGLAAEEGGRIQESHVANSIRALAPAATKAAELGTGDDAPDEIDGEPVADDPPVDGEPDTATEYDHVIETLNALGRALRTATGRDVKAVLAMIDELRHDLAALEADLTPAEPEAAPRATRKRQPKAAAAAA